jgi:hypothetical protein
MATPFGPIPLPQGRVTPRVQYQGPYRKPLVGPNIGTIRSNRALVLRPGKTWARADPHRWVSLNGRDPCLQWYGSGSSFNVQTPHTAHAEPGMGQLGESAAPPCLPPGFPAGILSGGAVPGTGR